MNVTPHVGIEERVTGNEWRAPLHEYEEILDGVTRKAWVSFTTLDGASVMLRSADVTAVVYVNGAAAEAINERLEQDKLR